MRAGEPAVAGTRSACSGIVLAGGRASRFGSDKLAARVDGRTLLERAVGAVGAVCDEVIVVGRDPLAGDHLPYSARYVPDARPLAGPLAALADGARAATAPVILVVGGDMPSLVPAVLALLVDTVLAGALAAELVVDGVPRTLPVAVDRAAALPAADAVLRGGERSLRALLDRLGPALIEEARWRIADPDGATLRDVDSPSDL
jgi:molybdopterin-guanine dinucleotide biosynthesis protein A